MWCVCAQGRNAKVSLSVHRVRQVSGWARATVELWDARGLSDALPWSLCSLSCPPGLEVSRLFSWFPPPSEGGNGQLRGFCYWMKSPWCVVNAEIKILARVLANRLQLVISDLIGPEQNYSVKGRSIQDNLHLVREVLEGIKDDTKAALINSDQYKAFDRVNHRLLKTVLETAGFKPEFCKWVSMLYHKPQAVLQMNGESSESFALKRSVRQGCTLLPLLYVLALEPLLRKLRDKKANPALRGVLFAGRVRTKVSGYSNNITVFVSRR